MDDQVNSTFRHGQTVEPAGTSPEVGRSRIRFEDERLVRGAGHFVDDLAPEGCLHLVFVRGQTTGQIRFIDASAARGMPDVIAILTAVDFPDIGTARVNALLAQTGDATFEPLARLRISAPGQAVACVVATRLRAAQDAAEAVLVTIVSPETPEPTVSFCGTWTSASPVTAIARTFDVAVQHARLAPCPLEPRATLAVPDGDGLTVYATTQTPHRMRSDLAHILRRPADTIRVIAPDVGGAFGGKASIYPEDAAVALAALRLGAPVKWCATRSEDFLSATQARGACLTGRLGVDGNGQVISLDATADFPLGHWLPYSAAAPLRNACRILPGPYNIAQVQVSGRAASAAMPAVNIYRGAGRPEAAMLMERLMDEAAHGLGIDPLHFRLQHLLQPGDLPRRSATGETLDSGDFPHLLMMARDTIGYAHLRREQTRRRRKGDVFGIGIACYIEPCGQGWESARISLGADGRIIAATGTSAQGQGRETAFAQIVANVLGCAPEQITLLHGDTGATPNGIGALASRSTAIGGSALRLAAETFLEKATRQAARLHCAMPGGVDRGSGAWPALAAALARDEPDQSHFLATDHVFDAPGEAWSSGAVIAAVSIERETGILAVERLVWADDAGVVVNPLLVEGQLLGGLAQGFGEAMMEQLVHDTGGQLQTGSFMDYALPRAIDVPKVELLKLSIPSLMNPLGAKGVGEAGCIGIPAAIVNAAVDALRPFGVSHLDMPLRAEKLWRAMNPAAAQSQDTP